MKPPFLAFLLVACLFSEAANSAEDAEVSVLRADRLIEITAGAKPEIYIDGELTDATIGKFVATVVTQQLTAGTVYFNSPGGNLLAGIEFGRQIRKTGWSTRIGTKGAKYGEARAGLCSSACVFAYVGGYYRFSNQGSRIGVHRFSTQGATSSDLDVAQVASAAITAYLGEMGVDIALFERMVQAGKDEVLYLSPSEARVLRVVNDGILPATWSLQNAEEIMYLKGEQETSLGIGKFMLMCSKGSLIASGFYEAGTNASIIAASTNRYSLRVDRDFLPIKRLSRPVQAANEYVAAYFQITPDQVKRLLFAQQVGLAFHPPNPDLFYGFQIDIAGNHQKIVNYVKYCGSQSR